MAKVLEHLGAIGGAILPARRKTSRTPVNVAAKVTSSRGDSASMTIGNVSTHGCNVRGEAGWLRMGGFVSVRLTDDQPLQAIVRWVRDGTAGLEFLRPVPVGHTEWHELINTISDM